MAAKGRQARYKIKCLKDGLVFNTIDELCKHYGFSKDQVMYRLDDGREHKDGYSYERVWEFDNTEALETVKNVDSAKYVEKFGDKTVPLPGYEDRYTISTSGVITNIKTAPGEVLKVKTKKVVKNTVVLHKDHGWTQVHNVENLLESAFGDTK